MSEENFDLDAMINNPFRTFHPRSGNPAGPEPGRTGSAVPRPEGSGVRPAIPVSRPEISPKPEAPSLWMDASSAWTSAPEERREPAGDPRYDRLDGVYSEPDGDHAERNHPLGLRVLALEKNEFVVAKKLDDLRRIIEHQNERIRLLEEELAIYRKASGNGEEQA